MSGFKRCGGLLIARTKERLAFLKRRAAIGRYVSWLQKKSSVWTRKAEKVAGFELIVAFLLWTVKRVHERAEAG